MLTLNFMDDLMHLQDQINQVFDQTAAQSNFRKPAFNLGRSEDGLSVTTELPGIDPNQLSVSVKGDVLEIRGTMPVRQIQETERWLLQERAEGAFVRQLDLPFRVDADKVSATYKNGILSLNLPRAEAEKPKRIAVSASS